MVLVSAFTAGVLTSASPCVLAAVPLTVAFVGSQAQSRRQAWVLSLAFVAGMVAAFAALGLAAAQLGTFFGGIGGWWSVTVGAVVIAVGGWLLVASNASCGLALPMSLQARLKGTGLAGALVLGALAGTIMTPCATPALAAALALAGSGTVLGGEVWLGAGMLVAYGLGHSVLLLAAGVAPSAVQSLVERIGGADMARPIRIALAMLLIATGAGITWGAIGDLGIAA